MSIPNTTYRVLVEKLGDSVASQFIGNEGEVFYDPNNPERKLSNGTTPGGLVIGGSSGGGGSSSQWVTTSVGIHTLSNVGIGTTNPNTTSKLSVLGNVSIVGILTVGSSSITINGLTDVINVGSGVTINGPTKTIQLGNTLLTENMINPVIAGMIF